MICDRPNNNLEKFSHHPSNVLCRHCNNCQLASGKECTPDLPDSPTKFATTQLEAQVHTTHMRSKKLWHWPFSFAKLNPKFRPESSRILMQSQCCGDDGLFKTAAGLCNLSPTDSGYCNAGRTIIFVGVGVDVIDCVNECFRVWTICLFLCMPFFSFRKIV